ncbi:MAG: hypothetical protein ACRD22_11415 [Terriglobia bacterium]
MQATAVETHAIDFNEEQHVYRVGGVIRPSVTQALKDAGLIDTAWYTEEARLRGKAVHAATQFLDDDDLDWDTVLPQYCGFVHAWEQFRRDSGFRISCDSENRPFLEYRLYHAAFGYCGTLDRLGMIGSSEYLIDLKTGDPEGWHGYQLAGYSQCLPDALARRRMTVHLKANGRYATREYGLDRFAHDWQVFSASVVVWHARNRKRSSISHGLKQTGSSYISAA